MSVSEHLKPAFPAILFIFLLFPGQSFAEVYKWVDENGRTHFGDKPLSSDAEKVTIKKESGQEPGTDRSAMSRGEKQRKLLDIYQKEREERKVDLQAKKEQEKKRKAKCDKAKAKLAEMRDASYFYEKTDDPQNPKILTETARKQAESKLEQAIKKRCN